jgi:hypothetical protein
MIFFVAAHFCFCHVKYMCCTQVKSRMSIKNPGKT